MVKRFNGRMFRLTDKPYIPLLRIALSLIVLKELLTILYKQANYGKLVHAFFETDVLTEQLFSIVVEYNGAVKYLAIILALLSSAGVLTRLSLFLYAFLSLGLFYLENSFGVYNHEAGMSAQVLMILIFSPGVTNWSIDMLVKHRGEIRKTLIIKSYWDWGVKLILLLLVTGYLTAGVSKVRYGGLAWLDGHTLEYYLSGKAYYKSSIPQKFILSERNDESYKPAITAYTYGNFQSKKSLRQIAKSISENEQAMVLLSILTIVFEVSSIFILFSRAYRNIFLLFAIGFHFSIRLLMGLGFLDYQIMCLSLINWSYFVNSFKRFARWQNWVKAP